MRIIRNIRGMRLMRTGATSIILSDGWLLLYGECLRPHNGERLDRLGQLADLLRDAVARSAGGAPRQSRRADLPVEALHVLRAVLPQDLTANAETRRKLVAVSLNRKFEDDPRKALKNWGKPDGPKTPKNAGCGPQGSFYYN